MLACIDYDLIKQDSRFPDIYEYCKNHGFKGSETGLCSYIVDVQEHYGYADDWMPETAVQRGVLLRYIETSQKRAREEHKETRVSKEDAQSMVDTLYMQFSPSELEDCLTRVVDDFQLYVDRLQSRIGETRTRQQIIAEAGDPEKKINGYVAIMQKVYEMYKDYYSEEALYERCKKQHPEYTEEQLKKARDGAARIANNYNRIVKHGNTFAILAAGRIGEMEGFYVDVYNNNIDFNVATEETEDAKNPDEGTDATEGSKGERYADFRITELHKSLSPKLKRALNNIIKTDIKGRIQRDIFGRPTYVDAKYATAVLQRLLVTSTSESMISDLQKATMIYPWLSQLIKKMQAEPDLAALVYSGCKTVKNNYIYGNVNKSGVWDVGVCGDKMDGYALAMSAQNNLSRGVLNSEWSYYENGRLKKGENRQAVIDKIDAWNKVLYDNKVERMEAAEIPEFLDKHPEILDGAVKMISGLGIEVEKSGIRTLIERPLTQDWYKYVLGTDAERNGGVSVIGFKNTPEKENGLSFFARLIGGARATLLGNANLDRAFYFNSTDWLRFARYLAPIVGNETEMRVNSEGKSLAVRTHTNLLHQAFSLIETSPIDTVEALVRRIEKIKEILRFEGMGLNDTTLCFGATGWLKKSLDGETFQLANLTAMDHVTYDKYDAKQRALNQIVLYCNGADRLDPGQGKGALYSVPIQADYARWENNTRSEPETESESESGSEQRASGTWRSLR